MPFDKDPQDKLDYGFDFTGFLGGDTITTSTWTASPDGLTLSNMTHDATKTTVWLAGGTVGETYKLVNHIVTAAGREKERSFRITIKEV